MPTISQPLGLPKGSVRGILALLVVGSAVIDTVINGDPNAALTAMAGSVLTYYFVKREGEEAVEALPVPYIAEDELAAPPAPEE
jgi:uncharacterized membrane protein